MGDFIGGMVLSAVLTGFLTHMLSVEEYEAKLTDCQKDLPRSQNCVLIAVPKLVLDASKESKEK